VGQIGGMSHKVLLEYGVGFSLVMIIVRMAWVYGETYIAYAIRRWIQRVEAVEPNPRTVFVIGWGGMRGVLSLAAAVSLPYALPNGSTFPQRSMIIYLAFCLIVTTLVFQGLTLPWLIRKLGLSESERMNDEEQEARRILLREALVHLDRKRSRSRDQAGIYSELVGSYQRRLDALPAEREEPIQRLVDHASRQEAVLSVLQVEREALIRLRDAGRIDDEVMRTLQRELDLTESRMHSGSLLLH